MRTTILLTVLWMAAPIGAQETTGQLRGRVVGDSGNPIRAAQIIVSGRPISFQRVSRADENGLFVVAALPPGDYRLVVRALGFREAVADRVRVSLGLTTSLHDIALPQADVRLDPIVIRADAVTIDPRTTEIASRIDVRTAERLPINRDYTGITLLMPQVNESYFNRDGLNVAGATGLENAYFVDGMNVTEGFRNHGGISLPYNLIDHVELKTGGYDAQFGRALGGIISVITRNGGSSTAFSGFSQVTASALSSDAARGPLDLSTGSFIRYDAGVSVGGPMVSGRLRYFFAYDGAVVEERVQLPGGSSVDRTRTDHFATKLHLQVSERSDVTATVIGDPSRRRIVGNAFWGGLPLKTLANPDPYLGFWNLGGVGLTVGANRRIGESVLVESSLSHAAFRDETGPRTTLGATQPLYLDFTTAQWSGGYGNEWARRTVRTALSTTATVERGAHNVRVGLQFEENAVNENWRWPAGTSNGEGVIIKSGPDNYLGAVLDFRTRARNRIPALFAQTSVALHQKVRVNAGLRWSGQYFSSPTTGHRASIANEYQPRFGVIVSPDDSERQKITASVGRYYEQIPLQPISWFYGGLRQRFTLYFHDLAGDSTPDARFGWDDVPATTAIRGQHHDEVTAGYERLIAREFAFSVRGARRRLREVLLELPADSSRSRYESDGPYRVLGNPGRRGFANLLRPVSRYDAIELELSRRGERSTVVLSHVVSRKFGNYVGVFDQDSGNPNAQVSGQIEFQLDSAATVNAAGLLPNDRRHVFKAFGSYIVSPHLTVGGTLLMASGTPLSEWGLLNGDPGLTYLLGRRGAAGRSPTLRDASLRVSYDVTLGTRTPGRPRVVVDVLHLLSQREPVLIDQVRYLERNENGPTSPNPSFGTGIRFQPPMTLRIGVEIGAGPGR